MILPGDLVVWNASHKDWDRHPMIVIAVFNDGPRKFGDNQKIWFICQLLTKDGMMVDKYHFLLKKLQ
jgi:hypothetical protein